MAPSASASASALASASTASALSDARVIRGEGTPESRWRKWLPTAGIPVCSALELLPRKSRLVVVAPHPDDEVLACGGLMAAHAANAGETLIVAVSDGEASHTGAPGWTASNLAAARRAESAVGLERLGARDSTVVRLGLADGRINRSLGELSQRLHGLLKPTDVVVTTWRFDGHPDHDATGLATANACADAGCRLLEAPVWMWHWASPGNPRVSWRRLTGVAIGRAASHAKLGALAAHTTQLMARDATRGPVLGPEIVARAARDTEYFFV